MARGFGATDGGSTSDLITTAYSGDAQLMSWAAWVYQRSSGAGTFGRAVAQQSGKALIATGSPDRLSLLVTWSGASAQWSVPISLSTWYHLVVTYDHGSTANDPVMYLNGSSATVTEITAPAGTYTAPGNVYTLGNRPALDRCWDGRLAEVAIWSGVALSAAQAAQLARGASPLHYRTGLVCYVPMVRTVMDWKQSAAPTVSGTAVQPHPPKVFAVPSRRAWAVPAAAPPAPSADALFSHLGLMGVGR